MRLFDAHHLEECTVAVSRSAADTREAFDSVAADYDRSNVANPLLGAMRRRALAVLRQHVAPGSRLLDLGCGPGTDHAALVSAGYAVTAIDSSPAMVAEARWRAAACGLRSAVDIRELPIEKLDRLAPATFDAAYSNFGPLNCVPDLSDAARQIGQRLRPGGVLVASVIGRLCPWELALFIWRRNWSRARVRFADSAVPVPLNGKTVWTRYYSPPELEAAFAMARMSPVSLRALGLFAPPPYLERLAQRHPYVVGGLQRADDWFGGWPLLRQAGDHFLMVLRKR